MVAATVRLVKWWDETFWATAAITVVGVVLTVVGTLWISWRILKRQLAHERQTQDRLREQQLADLRAEVERDRRIRQVDGLTEGLGRLMHVMNSYARFRFSGMPVTAHHVTKQVYDMDDVLARMGRIPLGEVVSGLLDVIRGWALTFNHIDPRKIPDEIRATWQAVGFELLGVTETLRTGISHWEDSGELPGQLDFSGIQTLLQEIAAFTATQAQIEREGAEPPVDGESIARGPSVEI